MWPLSLHAYIAMIGRILHTFIAWCAAKRTQWMCYMWPQDVCSAQQFYIVSRPPLSCIKSDGWWLMNERLQGHFHRRMLHFWRVDLNMIFSYGMPEITSASQFMGFRFYGEHGFVSVRESYFINFRFFFHNLSTYFGFLLLWLWTHLQ